jgi:hypothetical protein
MTKYIQLFKKQRLILMINNHGYLTMQLTIWNLNIKEEVLIIYQNYNQNLWLEL